MWRDGEPSRWWSVHQSLLHTHGPLEDLEELEDLIGWIHLFWGLRISSLLTQVSSVAMGPYLNNRLDCRREGEEVSVGRTVPSWPPRGGTPRHAHVCPRASMQAWACVPSAGLSSSFGWWEPGWSRAGSGRGGRSRVGLKSATAARSPRTRFSAWGYLDNEETPWFAISHSFTINNVEEKSTHIKPSLLFN